MGKKTLLVDPSSCLQCSNCWVACKDEHCDNDWSPISKPQGEGQWWIRVVEHEAATGRHMKLFRVPVMCQHCEKCVLEAIAPEAVYKREDGIVIIDPEKAAGRKELVGACPYGAVFWNEDLGVAQKCTMCAHLLDSGWSQPRCVTACPNDALSYVDVDDLTKENLHAPIEVLRPEYGTDPLVLYTKMPKIFVAGECVSSDEVDCVEDALITLVHQVTGREYHGYSNTLGDFHIDVEEAGFYTAEIKADGYKRKVITDIDLRDCLSLDEIKLNRMVRNGLV